MKYEKTCCTDAALKKEVAGDKEYTWPSGAGGGPQLTTRKEMGPQSNSHKELNSASYLNKPGSKALSKSLETGTSYQYLDFGHVRPRSKKTAEPIQAPAQEKTIHLWCFTSINLW